MKQSVRAFVAIEVGSEVRSAAGELIEKLAGAGADVKWVESDSMHVTLKFLGDVALKETARICEAVQKAAEKVEPFDLEFCGAGAFPNAGRPRTVWLGTREGHEPMLRLFERVDARLGKLGFRRESRAFHAHLTLGRVRRAGPEIARLAQLLQENADYSAGWTRVDEVIVFSSDLGPSGPSYHPLGRAKLVDGSR
jgi:2'-5' RNA ligase